MTRNVKRCTCSFALRCIASVLLACGALHAQSARPLTWLDDLRALENASSANPGETHEVISRIRAEIANWLKLHPSSARALPAAPAEPWSAEETQAQISLLRGVVEGILKEDPGRPFHLGVAEVNVTAALSPLSPVADSIEQTEIANRNALTVAQAIQYLPGISVDHKAARNQSGISVRGFDTRQVPLYLDGIPIYVPYDGYVDLSRFLTSDIAEVQVAKGYSSPLMGASGLGGVINLVSRQPANKMEADAAIGTGSGNMLDSWLRLGSRWRHFFFQGSIDWLQSDFSPLSAGFQPNALQASHERSNSDQRDARYSGRLGWTPRGNDDYVFSYANQKGEYGVPPYAGSDLQHNSVKFWNWPYWNKASYYFHSRTGVGETGMLALRVSYDQYTNRLDMYDDATYSAMKLKSSGTLRYDDHTDGASALFQSRFMPRNVISASFFFKDDTHREQDAAVYPWQTDRDQQLSIGVEDKIKVSSRIHSTVGFSADHLDGLQAQDLLTTVTKINKTTSVTSYSLAPFQVPAICGSPATTSFSACTDHVWDYNPLASVSYAMTESGTLFATFTEKSHFPTLKDRYSYKFNKALPNPLLQPEHARSWTFGYSHAFASRTVVQMDLFHSSVRDAIENVTFVSKLCSATPGFCSQSVNVGREIHEGAEFTIRSTPWSRLTIDANYSFLNRSISDAPNVFPTGTPRHKTVGTATLRLPRQTLLITTARYESGAFTSNDSGLVVPASKFATFDVGGVVPLVAGMSVQGGVKNLLDRNYWYQEGFPEEGRNWYFSMRYRF